MVNSASYVNEDVMHYLGILFGKSALKELYYDFKGKEKSLKRNWQMIATTAFFQRIFIL